MDQATGEWFGLSSLGFYVFLAVWVGATIWSRTQERLAAQETLRKLIDRGDEVSPEVIYAVRRPLPKRTPAQVLASARRYLYWGSFLVVLGVVISLWQVPYTDKPITGIVLFGIPGLFCLAHALIKRWTLVPSQEQVPPQGQVPPQQ